MAELLDYADPSLKPIRKFWPRKVFAVVIAVYSLGLLVFNCVVGLIGIGSTSRVVREEAWLRVLVVGPSCLLGNE